MVSVCMMMMLLAIYVSAVTACTVVNVTRRANKQIVSSLSWWSLWRSMNFAHNQYTGYRFCATEVSFVSNLPQIDPRMGQIPDFLSQNVLTFDLKKSRICPVRAYLSHVDATPDIPVLWTITLNLMMPTCTPIPRDTDK